VQPRFAFYELPRVANELRQGELKNAYTNRSYVFPFEDSVLRDLIYGPKAIEQEIKKSA
jgi:hypothetical protein